jgi:hypothetical protein
MGVKER